MGIIDLKYLINALLLKKLRIKNNTIIKKLMNTIYIKDIMILKN